MALWDIVGKQAGMPVYNLLGGASRERVRVYANGWSDEGGTVDEVIALAVKVKELGYTALKFDPLPGAWRTFIDRQDEVFAVDFVRRMREALGPEMEILIELHRRLAPSLRDPARTAVRRVRHAAGSRSRASRTISSSSPRCGATSRSRW